jgi:hypothetical protein
MISLDRQSSSEVFFTVILVRFQKQEQLSIQKKFIGLLTLSGSYQTGSSK